jgi:hypothetical protein
MVSTREWIIFLAGAQTFHTITHILMNVSGALPIRFFAINLTPQLNIGAIFVNLLITAGLFWWLLKVR